MLPQFQLSISCLVKKCMNYDEASKFFYKKHLLKKKHVYRNQKLSIVYHGSLTSYTNKFFIFRYLLHFTTKCIGGQIKAFSFLLFSACDAKSTKGVSVNIQNDSEAIRKKKTDSSMFTCSEKLR